MNQAKTIFALLGIFTFIILSIGFASATTIFSDDFEDNDLSDWTLTSEGSANWTIDITSGYVEANGHSNSTMVRTISTTGYKDLIFSYDKWLGDDEGSFEGSEEFNVSYSTDGGQSWIIVESNNTNNTGFDNMIYDLNEASNDNSLFKIKFECTTDAQNEFCRVDNVVVEGTAIPSLSVADVEVNAGENATIVVTNTGLAELLTIELSEISGLFGTIVIEPSTISNLEAGATSSVNVILDSLTGIEFGTNILTILANDTAQPEANDTATITIKKTFCDSGEAGGNLTIDKVNIDNLDGPNDEWSILDEIEIEVKVENSNSGDYDLEDILIEIGFFDSTGDNFADELEFISGADSDGLTDDFDLDEGDDKTITIKFKVPADFEKGDYKFAIKTYSEDSDEDNECTDSSSDLGSDFYEDITIERESDDEKSIIVDDINFDDSEVTCGQTVNGEFTVYNIGTDPQEKILITMVNSALGLDEQFEVLTDMDEGDDGETFAFSFEVPEGTQDDNYNIGFTTYSDYDSDGDAEYFEFYKDRSDDIFYETLKVIGCETQEEEESVLVTAELDSEAEAGEELIVTSTITNLGDETATFAIDVTGFDEWAELVSLSDEVTTLENGESKEITITLRVNEDTEGTHTFVIETNSNGNLEVQQVEVSIAESTGFGGLGQILKNSGMLWLIGIINIVLIFLIILVAVRLSRR